MLLLLKGGCNNGANTIAFKDFAATSWLTILHLLLCFFGQSRPMCQWRQKRLPYRRSDLLCVLDVLLSNYPEALPALGWNIGFNWLPSLGWEYCTDFLKFCTSWNWRGSFPSYCSNTAPPKKKWKAPTISNVTQTSSLAWPASQAQHESRVTPGYINQRKCRKWRQYSLASKN